MTAGDHLIYVSRVYLGSDGEETKALYARLKAFGPMGNVAINLFRAHKASSRAKVYRGRSYRGAAYDKKQWSVDNLCTALAERGEALGIRWGWGIDEEQPFHRHVVYIDLPTGQVSFHAAVRGNGPDYPDKWDGVRDRGSDRILRWIARVFAAHEVTA